MIMPRSGKRADLFAHYLSEAMAAHDIDTRLRQAAFLAQVCVESGHLVYTAEIASGAAYDHRSDLGNTKPEAVAIAAQHGKTPGPWWKGHGLIQLTGYDNHKACGDALGLDLLNFPTLLLQPEHASDSAAWFWKTHGLNRWADAEDFDGVCDVINRGRKTVKIGDANGYAERMEAYSRAMSVLA
jgi:putative chitinase